jgi:hypothetical protein
MDVANCKLRLQIAKLDRRTVTCGGFVALLLFRPSGDAAPLNDTNEHDDYGYGQQDVDEPTQRERSNQSERPQSQKDECNCPQHVVTSFYVAIHFVAETEI